MASTQQSSQFISATVPYLAERPAPGDVLYNVAGTSFESNIVRKPYVVDISSARPLIGKT